MNNKSHDLIKSYGSQWTRKFVLKIGQDRLDTW